MFVSIEEVVQPETADFNIEATMAWSNLMEGDQILADGLGRHLQNDADEEGGIPPGYIGLWIGVALFHLCGIAACTWYYCRGRRRRQRAEAELRVQVNAPVATQVVLAPLDVK